MGKACDFEDRRSYRSTKFHTLVIGAPLSATLPRGGPHPLYGAPPGHDALALARAAGCEPSRTLLWILGDDRGLTAAAAALEFLAPEIEALSFPAWDCLPYDRLSPNPAIAGERLATLSRLAVGTGERPRIVLATVNSVLQRLPPKSFFVGKGINICPGTEIEREGILEAFERWGYRRASTVMEPGEYAPRGSILDVFPSGSAGPVRIDFFGDEIEAVRPFDPLTQRTAPASVGGVFLVPLSEVPFDEEGIQRFRDGYRETFGAVTSEDSFFETVSRGVFHPGVEHWLPLFHESMETIFDHVDEGPVAIVADYQMRAEERWENIADYIEARTRADHGRAGAPGMLPPDTLYVSVDQLDGHLASRPSGIVYPGTAPPKASGVDLHGRPGRTFASEGHRGPNVLLDAVANHVSGCLERGRKVAIACHSRLSRERLAPLLRGHGLHGASTAKDWNVIEKAAPGEVPLFVAPFDCGFESEDVVLVAEADIFGPRTRRTTVPRRRAEEALRIASSIEEGDLLVHADYGIGRYEGLETVNAEGAPHDCLRLIYRGGDRLFVPVEMVDLVTRYGRSDSDIRLDLLGGTSWNLRKEKTKKRIEEMANELISLAAERKERTAEVFSSGGDSYETFSAAFPFEETDDQLETIHAVEKDLGSGRPMDRLVCGDVGFGKTEVALRAARSVTDADRQVAVVVPTTLLALQHAKRFQERFRGTGITVAQLSRITPSSERNGIFAGLADGSIQIVVGTHALLGDAVRFAALGLLVIDEEQHFGVAQKERLKAFRVDVHVLTLTATPIPRTLHMALSGVRDLSLIATPPADRLAVRTYVMPFDPVPLGEALRRERGRGGQSFCVVPRIRDLSAASAELVRIASDAKIAVAHGRMGATALEETMERFEAREYDILLCTTIIENGLDIPNVNTLIVLHAERFGLAQLYQLRGRVGRSSKRGYAYFTLGPGQAMTEAATRRLHVLQGLDGLGAGFTLASHDLDIRGAGNLLGSEQSGHIREVGAELYQQLLAEAVSDLQKRRGEQSEERDSWTPEVRIHVPSRIPDDYVRDLRVRLALYRRLASIEDDEGIARFSEEIVDRFGPLPEEASNLLRVMEIRLRCREAGIERLNAGAKGVSFLVRGGQFAEPERLLKWVREQPDTEVRPDSMIVVRGNVKGTAGIISGALQVSDAIASLIQPVAEAREAVVQVM